jgi:hypothetical protein
MLFLAWLSAFALTQAVEVPIYSRAVDGPWRRRLAVGFAASAITHPLVWIGVLYVLPGPWELRVLGMEGFAIGVEALWLRRFGVRRALAWSMVANGASWGLGSLSRAWLGWP